MTAIPRLDLDLCTLVSAKKVLALRRGLDPETANLEKVTFSDTVDVALAEFSEHILACLESAGLRRQANVERGRPRRIRDETWQRLGELSDEFDISRVSFVRAALALLAKELEAPTPAEAANDSVPGALPEVTTQARPQSE
jgi:hypothetical protein